MSVKWVATALRERNTVPNINFGVYQCSIVIIATTHRVASSKARTIVIFGCIIRGALS
jgi:hypothetical protein